MDLILWRHAEAQEPEGDMTDMDRALTRRGEKQAVRMAGWLDRQLPEGTRVLVSPALRTLQTVEPLGRKFRQLEELRPDATCDQLLDVAGWPHARVPVLIVGHQPTLGEAVARLIGLSAGHCSVKKGAVWWLRARERIGHAETTVLTVMSPDMV